MGRITSGFEQRDKEGGRGGGGGGRRRSFVM